MATPAINGPSKPLPANGPEKPSKPLSSTEALTKRIADTPLSKHHLPSPPHQSLKERVFHPLQPASDIPKRKPSSSSPNPTKAITRYYLFKLGYLEQFKKWKVEDRDNFYDEIALLREPIADRCSARFFVNWLFSNILPEILSKFESEEIPIIKLQQFASRPFIKLMKTMNPTNPFVDFIMNKILEPKLWEERRDFLLTQALEKVSPDTTDFHLALAIDLLFQSPSDEIDVITRGKHKVSKSLTIALNNAIGERLRKDLFPGEILLYSHVLSDGIGDLIHLINCQKLIENSFGPTVRYAALLERETEARIDGISKIVDTSQISLEEMDYMERTTPPEHNEGIVELFKRAKIIFGISQSREPASLDLIGNKPHQILREISDPNLRRLSLPPMIMGLKIGNAGIWFSEPPEDPQNTLRISTDSLKEILGCNHLHGLPLMNWYAESLICATMVYDPIQDDRTIFASLAICQKTRPDIKRLIFKVKQSPAFLQTMTPIIIEQLQQLGVGHIIFNNKPFFKGDKPGIELRITTEKLNETDWTSYKQLVNGITGVGGDNTLSEALSNPNTLPPLIFSQHPDKQDAYYGVIDLAKELDDSLPGKKGLIEYLQLAKLSAYFTPPFEYGMVFASIVEKTGEESLRTAWKALTEHARQVANLSDFIVPLLTEQIFLAKNPSMRKIRREIIMNEASETSLAEKIKMYLENIQQ